MLKTPSKAMLQNTKQKNAWCELAFIRLYLHKIYCFFPYIIFNEFSFQQNVSFDSNTQNLPEVTTEGNLSYVL